MATEKEYQELVKALSGECERLHKENEELKALLEPCEDAISRDAINNLQKYRYNCGDTSITCVSLASINALPSVTQKGDVKNV